MTIGVKHPAVLTLVRQVRETCSLKIVAPNRVARSWSYAAGTGAIQFGVTPPVSVTRGVWVFRASCAQVGTSPALTAVTTLTVPSGPSGRSFITGPSGPVIFVPVGYGPTHVPSTSASHAGKGGDPGNDYPYAGLVQDSRFDPWGEYVRECTSFAAWALHSRNNFETPFYANARDWGPKAQALGYRVDGSPAAGSIAWSNAGYYGHVAWVLAVSGSQVTIEEYNYDGRGHYSSRTVPAARFTGYIHFADRPDAPTAPPPPPAGSVGNQPPPQQTPQPQPTPPSTYTETAGGAVHTWTDYANAGGAPGPTVGANQSVQISCRVTGFRVADGNSWWYLIASTPWGNAYYGSADAFYNNGQTSGSLTNTPFVDQSVPICQQTGGGTPPPPPPSYAETAGGPTNTWTNYSNAGGSQGPTIGSNVTVQIACKLTGLTVADGNTWWYRIASSPWNSTYYASADAFYNNGQTSGGLHGTPFVDSAVPSC